MTEQAVSAPRAPLSSTVRHEAEEISVGLWRQALQRLAANRMALISLIYLSVLAIVAILAPFIAPYPFDEVDLILGPSAPSAEHWLGTDDLGRDLLSRILWGARISLLVALLSTAVSVVIGVTYGALAGYIGGKVDEIMMRIVEILYTLPFMFFVIVLMVFFGRNFINLFIALGAISWLTMARIVRGEIVSLRRREFVEAARATGVAPWKILTRHLIPNALGPVIVYITLTIPGVILEEAFLSFLGLGVQEPMASLGTLISGGVSHMETSPWILSFPAAVLVVTLFALNFLCDGLRDALDPKIGEG